MRERHVPQPGPRVLLTCSAGPTDKPGTWSGTPHHLLRSLRDEGRLDVGTLGAVPSRFDRAMRRLDDLTGLRHPAVHGLLERWAKAAQVQHEARRQACAATLHFGSYDLPWAKDAPPAYLYVDTTYDLWERQSQAAQVVPERQRRWFRRLEQRALSRARHVFTVGQHVAQNMVDCFGLTPERVTAVGTGRGSIVPYSGPKDYRNGRLLTVAKVRPVDKGLPLLLEAFACARRRRPDLQLTVVGGERYPEIVGLAGVRGTGWISAEELQALYEQASLFVMPAMYEPWGLAYLEALACRTPLMGLARNAYPEISEHGRFGFVAASTEAEAFARELLGALDDTDRLARMGEAGQTACLQRYSWQLTAQRIAERIDADLRAMPSASGESPNGFC